MFNQGGLSLEQAPPISVVLKFFVTGAIFGTILGLFLLASSLDIILSTSYAFNLTLIHFLALGVMASFMLGAMFQMLPVLAGVVIKMPTKKAMVAHILLTIGILSQITGFYTSIPIIYLITAILLGGGLLHAVTLMLKELIKVKDHSSSSKGMIFALSSFFIVIIFGITMLLSLGGYIDSFYFAQIREVHYSFGLYGWIYLLIVSISFQVIEMFYVTPKYPNIISKYLTPFIFILLIIKTILLFMIIDNSLIDIAISTLFIIYAGVTIHRLYKRRRPTSDATVWFWRFGLGLSILSFTLILLDNIFYLDMDFNYISYIAFIGFGLSIVFAMVYKIVPFLVWFHLSNQGYMEAPMMHDVIHPKKAKIHFWIHFAVVFLWIINVVLYNDIVGLIANILLTISFGWLLYHLIEAIKKYRYVQKNFEKIEW
jgi:MFS family permease